MMKKIQSSEKKSIAPLLPYQGRYSST
jgi:hypothetical protein